MKWTYQEYEEQPAWLIDYLLEMLKAEAGAQSKALNDAKNKTH